MTVHPEDLVKAFDGDARTELLQELLKVMDPVLVGLYLSSCDPEIQRYWKTECLCD